MPVDSSEILTIEELSAYLKIPKSTLYKVAQEGGLPAKKVGKHWRFHKGAIEEWLRRQPGHGQGRTVRSRVR